jgi:hypothetical protein
VFGKILYWLAVLVLSVGLLILLVLYFESRDSSSVGGVVVPLWVLGSGAGHPL